MLSGKKNEDKANKATSNSLSSLKSKNYSDPFGSFDSKKGVYTPNLSPTQMNTLSDTQTGIGTATQALQKPFTVEDYFDNPFYENTSKLFSQPIQRQYEQDSKALDNELNARNQVGGSYDAYRKSLLTQGRDYNLNQAELQGRSASADAFNQAYQNAMASLQGLNQSQLAQQQYINQPFTNYLGYQGVVNPLQQGAANAYGQQANYYQTKKTGLDYLMDYYRSSAQIGATVAGAAV